ncbi:MAG: hypothetical protein JW829_20975 [Pirellulales bacterium]|nr:hypothetical protein [Pirellulales bacterium]
MKSLQRIAALLAGLFMSAGFTQADDYWIPEWRGQPGTTWAVWDDWIDNPQQMPSDHFIANPGVLTPPHATADPNSAFLMDSWTDVLGVNRWNVLHIVEDAALGFYLDNYDRNWLEKRVWIQITFDSDQAKPTAFYVRAGYPDQVVSTRIPAESVGSTELPGWVTAAYEFRLQPNPLWEEILLEFAWQGTDSSKHSAYVDQVVIDTLVDVELLPGDFDLDGDVDGADFLVWQRGESPEPLSASDLADWEANFGTVVQQTSLTGVPEPPACQMLIFCLSAIFLLKIFNRIMGTGSFGISKPC